MSYLSFESSKQTLEVKASGMRTLNSFPCSDVALYLVERHLLEQRLGRGEGQGLPCLPQPRIRRSVTGRPNTLSGHVDRNARAQLLPSTRKQSVGRLFRCRRCCFSESEYDR